MLTPNLVLIMPSDSSLLEGDLEDLDIQALLSNLDDFNQDELAEINGLVEELSARDSNQKAYDDLIEFCKRMQPDYIVFLPTCLWTSQKVRKIVSVLTFRHGTVSPS